jgi:hypothetical protein
MPTLEHDVDEGSCMEEVDYFWHVETMVVDVIKSWVPWPNAYFYNGFWPLEKGIKKVL